MLTAKEKFIAFLENESPRRGDVILLLEGDGYNRVKHAARLYTDNYAPKIASLGGDKRREYGSFPSFELKKKLLAEGVPKEAMYIEEKALNTLGEAQRAMILAKKYGWKSMILVTSPHHQFRAFLTFLKAMRDAHLDILLVNAPAHLPWFTENPWGKRTELLEGELARVDEYQKKGDCASFEEGLQYLADAERHLYGHSEDEVTTLRTRPTIIPYSTQDISEADVQAVSSVLRSSHLTQGPAIDRFERAIAQYTGAKYAVVVSSGTAALHAAYAVAGITKGDEVIVPGLTFAATGNAALYVGAKPVFADVSLATGNVDPKDVEKKITKKTKAIVAVDYAGRPADLKTLKALAKKHKLLFIEDASQGLGASYRGKKVGTHADMVVFSFHPVKTIATGEGGAITTNNPAYYEKLRMFRSHGITRDPKRLKEKNHAAWHQEMQLLGYNYRLSDIQAALGVSQMKRVDAHIEARRALAENYFELLKDVPGLILPEHETSHERSAWHLYPIRLAPNLAHKRDEFFTELRSRGIGVGGGLRRAVSEPS